MIRSGMPPAEPAELGLIQNHVVGIQALDFTAPWPPQLLGLLSSSFALPSLDHTPLLLLQKLGTCRPLGLERFSAAGSMPAPSLPLDSDSELSPWEPGRESG